MGATGMKCWATVLLCIREIHTRLVQSDELPRPTQTCLLQVDEPDSIHGAQGLPLGAPHIAGAQSFRNAIADEYGQKNRIRTMQLDEYDAIRSPAFNPRARKADTKSATRAYSSA